MCTSQVFMLSLLCFVSTCWGQADEITKVVPLSGDLHHGLTEKIGNFSIELLYHTMVKELDSGNLIISPVTAWTLLAVIAEGASENTLREICRTIRVLPRNLQSTRREFQSIAQWLRVNTSTVELEKLNTMFVNESKNVLRDFIGAALEYDTKVVTANFDDSELTANTINTAISKVTHGHISSLVNSDDFVNAEMVLTSVLYFKGQWEYPFNASLTEEQPFYDSNGDFLGNVNMMYSRYNYPWSNVKSLDARILEVPYGKEKRLSMLIMLPYPGVTLTDMFLNFNTVPLDTVFSEIKKSAAMYSDEEVDFYLPRFKIQSDLVLTDTLRMMGIVDLFDQTNVRLPKLARKPLHVTKVIHKAEIEVTEEGTIGAAVTAAEFANRIGNNKFVVNRPFVYLIIEKVTNTITFGGFYRVPSLY